MLRKPAVSVYVVVLCLGIHLENVYNLYFKVLYFPHDFDCEYLEYLLSLNCYVTNALLSLSLSVTLRHSPRLSFSRSLTFDKSSHGYNPTILSALRLYILNLSNWLTIWLLDCLTAWLLDLPFYLTDAYTHLASVWCWCCCYSFFPPGGSGIWGMRHIAFLMPLLAS